MIKRIDIDEMLSTLETAKDGFNILLQSSILSRSNIESELKSLIETAMMMDNFVKERSANMHKDELTKEELEEAEKL